MAREKKLKRGAALRLEVPYSADAPRLTSEAVGLVRVMHRPAANRASLTTVFDVPDGRLLRDGVIVTHRVEDGVGQWRLEAPRWAPPLPEQRNVPMSSSGDLPEEFHRLLRPFIRHGVLGPIAGIAVESDEWALRDEDGEPVAEVRDQLVTIRRSGLTTARFREITITASQTLTPAQIEFLLEAGRAVNATQVDEFPSLQQRLGAPATGLTNFPEPQPVGRDSTLEQFVSEVFARHLRAILRSDLERRAAALDGDAQGGLGPVNARLWEFGRDLRGLAPVLEPGWRQSVEELLGGLPFESDADLDVPVPAVLEALIGAVQAPRLGDLSQRSAEQVLFDRAEAATYILADRCRALTQSSPDERWAGALMAAEQLEVAAAVATPLFRKSFGRLRAQLEEVTEDLRGSVSASLDGEPELDGLSANQAYQLGLDSERTRSRVRGNRELFIQRWPERVVAARKALAKAGRKRKVKR